MPQLNKVVPIPSLNEGIPVFPPKYPSRRISSIFYGTENRQILKPETGNCFDRILHIEYNTASVVIVNQKLVIIV